MTASVTVCIPAYRSEAFIHETLKSVLAQTQADFVVDIAIEPPAEATLAACAPFLADSRVRTSVNPEVLGWAGNIREMLRRVATPYFFILPHDDLLAPDYVATLAGELARRPEAGLAYCDIDCFGAESFRAGIRIVEEPLFDRLMTFLIAGAEAWPMRGLTRASLLADREFPTDRHGGFAVECEWVLDLLAATPVVHVPRLLYAKRIFGADRPSVSTTRLHDRTRADLLAALEEHRVRMLAILGKAELHDDDRVAVELAAEAAMLRRHVDFGMGAFSSVQLDRLGHLVAAALSVPGAYGRAISGMGLLALSHHALAGGDTGTALSLAIAAAEADPEQWEAHAHLARLKLAADDGDKALVAACRAWALAPQALGLEDLIACCAFRSELKSGKAATLARRFDGAAYLEEHPDVAAAGVDPWWHFCEFGWREGRRFRLLA